MSHEAGQDITDAIAIYNPNGPAAIIFFLVYLTIAAGLWYRHFKTHPRAKYMRPVRWGATIMAFGYLARFTRRDGINAWSWLFETMFILLSPCLFLAQVYVLLPRLAETLDMESSLPIGRRTIKWVLITADVGTVLAQLAGTALTITFGDLVKIGKLVVTIALWVQLAFFLSFMLIFVIFAVRLRRCYLDTGKQMACDIGGTKWFEKWQSLIAGMFVACLCLFIRSIYRVAEYTSGAQSALAYSEAAFYILDAIMMLSLILVFGIIWPPSCFEVKVLPSGVPGLGLDLTGKGRPADMERPRQGARGRDEGVEMASVRR